MSSDSISIVVPVFNERGNIAELHQALVAACKPRGWRYEIVFVDDGSTDGSGEVMEELAAQHAPTRTIRLKRNFGQSAALAAGMDYARGDYIVTIDADLQNDPADIPRLVDTCKEGYDLVSGWRRRRKDPFLAKTLPSKVANSLIRHLTGVPVHDTGCTLKVFHKEIVSELHLYGEMHRFIPALLHWSGAHIAELEVTHHPRRHGTSKYGLSKLWRVVLDLVTVRFLLQYATRPIQMFGKFGLLAFGLSFFSFCALAYMKLYWETDMTGNPFLLLTVFLFFLGVQFVTMGFLGEINTRTYHETTGRKIYRIAGSSEPGGRTETTSPWGGIEHVASGPQQL